MAVLEGSVTSKTRENMKKSPKPPKNEKNQVKKLLVVAQELKFAKGLAGNNKVARGRALKRLQKWFKSGAKSISFAEDDFMRLWKGLFYNMWMSDKPLVQEECAQNISDLLHCLPLSSSLLFYKCGMTLLMNEWFGIDQLRIDKFLMFVRRLLRQALFVLKKDKWGKSAVKQFTWCLSVTILEPYSKKPVGLLLHFIEIFLEELAKVSDESLSAHMTAVFLAPFVQLLASSDDPRVIDHIRKHIFVYLIRQSDLGLEYNEKYIAWRDLGFPGSIDLMQKVEDPEESDGDGDDDVKGEATEENGEKVYDPRAGRVDVELAQIKFHPRHIAKALADSKFGKNTNMKSRKVISELIEHFKKLASGIYPLGVKKVKVASDTFYDTNIRKAVNRLVKFDQKIKGTKKNTRKNEDSHEIELRGGKKIKLDEEFTQKIQEDLTRATLKRKIEESAEMPPKKLQKQDEPQLLIESMFKRNSGIWMVTKAVEKSSDKIVRLKSEWQAHGSLEESDPDTSLNPDVSSEEANIDQVFVQEVKQENLFPKNKWDTSDDDLAVKVENSLKRSRLSLPGNLMKNPFSSSSPMKKVKINTNLNKTQDVLEHVAQIFSSPDIPYDPEKKPTKPLLKTPLKGSPINPFYVK